MSDRLWTGLVKRGKYWCLRYRVPGEARERRKSLGVRDKRVAETRRRDFEEDFEREQEGMPAPNRPKGSPVEGAIMPLLEECLAQRRTRGTGEKQLGHVRRDVETVCSALGWTRLRDINSRDYQTWQRSPSVAGSSARTKNNRLKNFQSFLNQTVQMKLIADNPLSTVPPINGRADSRRKRRALSDAEIRRLLAKSPMDRRMVYLTVLHTGLRRGDLEALLWRDVVLDDRQPFIQLWAQQTKGRRDERVSVHPELADALRAYRSTVGGRADRRVFPRVPRVQREFRGDLEAAGIPFEDKQGRRVDLHALRKTCNTRMAANGVPISIAQKQMRHTDIRLTAVDYMDFDGLPVAEKVAAMPSILPPLVPIAVHGLGPGGHAPSQAVTEGPTEPLAQLPPTEGIGRNLAQTVAPGREGNITPAVGFEPTT